MLEKLALRGIVVDRKEKIKTIKSLLIQNEHPDYSVNSEVTKYFLPKLLTVADWMKENLVETLLKIEEIRHNRCC